MEVFEALQTRRSIRKYKNLPVEKEKMDKILEAARISPSSSNKQQWKFVVVDDKKMIADFVAVAGSQAFVGESAAILAVCAPRTGTMTCGQPRNTVDASIAASYIMIEAHELGLGTCWLGNFQQQPAKDMLGVPEDWDVVVLLTLGYPDESPSMTRRKAMEEVASHNKF